MYNPNGNSDLADYLHAWAVMMITIWQEKMIMLNVGTAGQHELYESFVQHVLMHSGGDQAKIEFAFNLYGFYVNAGVGGEVSRGNDGDLIDVSHYNKRREVWQLARKPKPFFDKGWYKSIFVLRRDVAQIFGDKAAKGIVFYLNNASA